MISGSFFTIWTWMLCQRSRNPLLQIAKYLKEKKKNGAKYIIFIIFQSIIFSSERPRERSSILKNRYKKSKRKRKKWKQLTSCKMEKKRGIRTSFSTCQNVIKVPIIFSRCMPIWHFLKKMGPLVTGHYYHMFWFLKRHVRFFFLFATNRVAPLYVFFLQQFHFSLRFWRKLEANDSCFLNMHLYYSRWAHSRR